MESGLIQENREGLRELAGLLKALADETRLTIVTMLLGGEMCVCEIMDGLPLSQPAVSHHLKVLRQVGLVTDAREGKWVYYDLDPAGFKTVRTLLEGVQLLPLRHRDARAGRRRRHPRCSSD